MKNRTLSMVGFFIDSLHIKTVSMAAALHVDASLISKWKSGKRILTDKSMYFDDVIAYFLEQNRNLGGRSDAPSQHACGICLGNRRHRTAGHQLLVQAKPMDGTNGPRRIPV